MNDLDEDVPDLMRAFNQVPRGSFEPVHDATDWIGLRARCGGLVHAVFAYFSRTRQVPGFECESTHAELPYANRQAALPPVQVLPRDTPVTCLACCVEQIRWRQERRALAA